MENKDNKLIEKFLSGKLDEQDAETLKKWMQHPDNAHFLKEETQLYYRLNALLHSTDTEKAYQKNISILPKKAKRKFPFAPVFKYAAVAILVIALGATYLLRNTIFKNQTENNMPLIVNNQIEPGSDKATLTLEDGTEVTLVKGTSVQTQNAISNGEEIIYNTINSNTSELVYNYLSVPRGGQFFLKLSDGTKIWLNSESQLKYPVSFTEGESRQVELVYGEAYFEVSHSTEHKGSDFKVFHDTQEIQVLGTQFNIKAYKDETNIMTTLVTGKVAVKCFNQSKTLMPNEQSVVNLSNKTIKINDVDTYREIAWKDGIFSFRDKPLKDIMLVLSRWYDMNIEFKDSNIESVTFNGVLNKNQDIIAILNMVKTITQVNYEIQGKKVILK